MNDEESIQKGIATRLIAALRQGEFVLYGQRIMPLAPRGGARPFREILIRFREEEEKLLPPGTFFPLLEEYHLLPYLDRWVISRLARLIADVRAAEPEGLVSCNGVNLSGDTLRDPGFADFTIRHIQNSRLPESAFIFEIGWDTAILWTQELQMLQAKLKPAGCRFALAGFDGSETSFGFLKTIAPDFVKLSYGIVKDINRSLDVSEKTKSINSRCQALGVKTIVEFVEDRDLLRHLRALDVDFAQGLGLSPPEPLT
jgi:EAL domain-containing protein (putative c-di-GMP-specific phosphodiesterase class I)